MKRFILGVVAGIAVTLLGGFVLCEVVKHYDLPLEVPEKRGRTSVSQSHLRISVT